jgi:hypothetical protein
MFRPSSEICSFWRHFSISCAHQEHCSIWKKCAAFQSFALSFAKLSSFLAGTPLTSALSMYYFFGATGLTFLSPLVTGQMEPSRCRFSGMGAFKVDIFLMIGSLPRWGQTRLRGYTRDVNHNIYIYVDMLSRYATGSACLNTFVLNISCGRRFSREFSAHGLQESCWRRSRAGGLGHHWWFQHINNSYSEVETWWNQYLIHVIKGSEIRRLPSWRWWTTPTSSSSMSPSRILGLAMTWICNMQISSDITI